MIQEGLICFDKERSPAGTSGKEVSELTPKIGLKKQFKKFSKIIVINVDYVSDLRGTRSCSGDCYLIQLPKSKRIPSLTTM